ncbi:mannose-P-dolichol utilization defect 1 protein [Coleophoma crateriformis]|uniref:Mannose-P-dolichol utilization defect 1 protein homolog n=1 Tax=Coleophoma crateriformis TaxID=565419 RepID=A0A3D8R7L6_9HELO|nr:mannose-P-dolichol utilization defect 1 protein [Coleophoma crateriformis]
MDSLRAIVQPITHNLPAPIADIGTTLLGEQCYKTLILDVSLDSPDCLKLAISKGLGIGIIATSTIVKVPQILKLLNSKSATGISFLSYLLETSAYLISLAYNFRKGFAFSTYGETALIMVQNVVIAVLVLNYSGQKAAAAVFVAGLAVAGASLFGEGIVDMNMLSYLQAGAGVLGIASKVPQILAVYSQGSTGQLSAFAVFNYLIGSLSRIFTTLQEVDDKLILYGFIAGGTLNAILALQMIYYWNAPAPASKPVKGKEKGKAQAIPMAAATTSGSSVSASKGKSPTTRRRG